MYQNYPLALIPISLHSHMTSRVGLNQLSNYILDCQPGFGQGINPHNNG